MNELYIGTIKSLDDPEVYDQAYSLMSKQRKKKIDRYHGRDDAKRSITAEMLLRRALSDRGYESADLIYEYGTYGKPYLKDHPDFFFSISHSRDHVILAVSDKEIGCDIEKIRNYDQKVVDRFFTLQEKQMLEETADEDEKRRLFLRYWTMKESYIKYTGEGLRCPLDSFVIETDEQGNTIIDRGDTRLYISEIDILDDYCISVCSADRGCAVKMI